MTLYASVYKLRSLGVLSARSPTSDVTKWPRGILEFSTSADEGALVVPRRLVLRNALANPTKGVMSELYRPELIDAQHPHLRIRGVEPTRTTPDGPVSAMVQEWLIVIGYQAGPDGNAPFSLPWSSVSSGPGSYGVHRG